MDAPISEPRVGAAVMLTSERAVLISHLARKLLNPFYLVRAMPGIRGRAVIH